MCVNVMARIAHTAPVRPDLIAEFSSVPINAFNRVGLMTCHNRDWAASSLLSSRSTRSHLEAAIFHTRVHLFKNDVTDSESGTSHFTGAYLKLTVGVLFDSAAIQLVYKRRVLSSILGYIFDASAKGTIGNFRTFCTETACDVIISNYRACNDMA